MLGFFRNSERLGAFRYTFYLLLVRVMEPRAKFHSSNRLHYKNKHSKESQNRYGEHVLVELINLNLARVAEALDAPWRQFAFDNSSKLNYCECCSRNKCKHWGSCMKFHFSLLTFKT